MARKIRTQSDPALAEAHKAGAPVNRVQPSLHETYGLVWVPKPAYWPQHFKAAADRRVVLGELDVQVLETELGKSGSRVLSADLTNALYVAGAEAVIHTVLAVHQLVTEMELALKLRREPLDNLNTRLGVALGTIDYKGLGTDPRYGRFAELQEVRDALEHPEEATVYNSTEGDWDRVPIAWITSGKALTALDMSFSLFGDIVKAWSEYTKAHASGPGTLTGVTRGIRSLHAAKKNRHR